MSRSRTIVVALTAGALLAMSLVGCAKAVAGFPEAKVTPLPTTTPKPTTGSGGSGGSGNTQGGQFCSTITPDMVQQAFGASGATITPGQQQDTDGVAAVSCTIAAQSGSSALGIDVIAFNYGGQANVTSQSALQNAQNQLQSSGHASNFQPQTGVGDADGAFSYSVSTQGGATGFAVFAAKTLQGSTAGIDVTAVGQVQLDQVIKFAGIVVSS
ncbi:MAG TPA: hypothetical protein VJ914_09855 [Pseudonocardiaceae bacterium]|nr:hypothetical protein [Pseudonocardiaceae bacterium]